MKKIVSVIMVLALFCFSAFSQDRFDRSAVIPAEPLDIGGFGNVVAGVDFDNDGKLEIYAVNNDWHDVIGKDLTPRIYKYEQNLLGKWEIVWSTELNLSFQNTWPAMEAADLDKDGRMEIVYGPVNNFGSGLQPNPERIVVFESAGDGSDVMGVADGAVAYRPNAQWTITSANNDNLRPFRWFIKDLDNDGTDEILAGLRAGAGAQVYSVDNIPDNGDSSEVWTLEFSGASGTHYDCFVLDSTLYLIKDGGDVTPVTWSASGDTFRVDAVIPQAVPKGSWYSATAVDIDGDGNEEVLVASWNSATSAIYLLQKDADTLKTTMIKDVPDIAGRLYGGAAGDLDDDGLTDFVFGTRGSTPNGQIYRLEYQGGAIDDMNNYTLTLLDHSISKVAIQYDVIRIANLDDDPEQEVIYTGTPRGKGANDPPQPIVILDKIPLDQPIIESVTDVPNDQGRLVRVEWLGSDSDQPPENGLGKSNGIMPITEYSVWRMIHPMLKTKALGKLMKMNDAMWEMVNVTKAIQLKKYGAVVPTLVDSIEGGGEYPPWSRFVVVAHTEDPLVNFKSFSKVGFSVDNLVPMAPADVMAKEIYVDDTNSGVELTWAKSLDEDFKYFAVYRSESPGIDPKAAAPITTTTGTEFIDAAVTTGATYYYAITAFDFNKNQSDPTEASLVITGVTANDLLPTEYALDQNFPNPFNPTTNIKFSLKENGFVTLKVYSALGQEVATIVNKNYERGHHTVTFDATGIASGVYFYVLKVNDLTFKKKMSILK